ncbi:MAG: histidine phosphatase family protein [Bacteroides sp.]|nr:histidine phosphatase family protein [Bacteroides sp.]
MNRLSRWLCACAMLVGLSTALSALAFETLPKELDGTMMPYDFSLTDSVTPWSGSRLHPVKLLYVARHGARYLSSEKKVDDLLKAIRQAKEQESLTQTGMEFAKLLDTVCSISKNRWGALSMVGEEEEQRLGQELCRQLPEMSKKMNGIAVSSYVPRVVRTMWDFLYPVAANSKYNSLTTSEGQKYSPLVRFFETDSLYAAYIADGDWKPIYKEHERKTISPEPARRLFGTIGDDNRMRKLTLDIYGVLQGLRAVSLPAPDTRWMTEEEYRQCWEVNNLQKYLVRSQNSLSPQAMSAAASLLRNIIEGAEKADSINARFWFGHAETIMPLVALMDLPGCTASPKDLNDIGSEWKDYEISPLGANVMIVLLKSQDDTDLRVAVRLNGRWISPVPGGGLIPRWKTLRDLWEQRLTEAVRRGSLS